MAKVCLLVCVFVATSFVMGCSSSDSGGSSGSSSGSSGTTSSSSSSSGSSGGGCSGDIANCALGSLSADQQNDMCSTLSAATDDPPGTKYECEATGNYISVNSKETCIAQPAKSTCKVTLTYLLGCYKAAKMDACSALGDDGACSELFDSSSGCN